MKRGSLIEFMVAMALLASNAVSLAETPQHKAWRIIQTGAAEKDAEVRTMAVCTLGLLIRNPKAAAIAEKALKDDKPEVRIAAARALGQMVDVASIPKLRNALSDKEGSVVMAAAHSLILLKDPAGYEFYYSVLTGVQKKTESLIGQDLDVLKDPKKVAEFSLEEGIGFLPYGDYGISAFEFIRKEEQDESSAKIVAAKFLVADPDPESSVALGRAASDKSWLVRQAALEAIARRGDPSLLARIQVALSDENDHVRYAAAAAVIRLTDVPLLKDGNK
jgi:HEAT repeat protein